MIEGDDLDRVTRWLDEQGVRGDGIAEVAELGGGTQNVMVRFRRGVARYVLHRPRCTRGQAATMSCDAR